MDELALIAAAQHGDLEAFNRLVLAYQEQVYNLALRFLSDEDAAEDAAQTALSTHFKPAFISRRLVPRLAAAHCFQLLPG
jgi:Sigma-70 region 2.